MYNPSRDQVRSFFIETWRKQMRERGQDSLLPR